MRFHDLRVARRTLSMKLYTKTPPLLRRRARRSSTLTRTILHYSSHWGGLKAIATKNHPLNGALLKQCREYAADRFGEEFYAFELARYCAIHGVWRDGWVPETYFQSEIVARTTEVPRLSGQKTLSGYLIGDGPLPDIGYFCNGHFFRSNWELIPTEALRHVLFEGRDRIVFKINNSMRGRGVVTFSCHDFDHEVIQGLGDGCFQEYIRPHDSVPSFDVPSVPTLRLVTTLDRTGHPTARFGYLRLGRSGHAHVMSDDSVKILVCLDTGKLQSLGYLTDWTPVAAHPDTTIPFEGVQYPRIDEAIAVCLRLHRKMPSFISIGWDLCLNDSGKFVLMEWNQLHDIKFAEAVNGPNFADLGWEKERNNSHRA